MTSGILSIDDRVAEDGDDGGINRIKWNAFDRLSSCSVEVRFERNCSIITRRCLFGPWQNHWSMRKTCRILPRSLNLGTTRYGKVRESVMKMMNGDSCANAPVRSVSASRISRDNWDRACPATAWPDRRPCIRTHRLPWAYWLQHLVWPNKSTKISREPHPKAREVMES